MESIQSRLLILNKQKFVLISNSRLVSWWKAFYFIKYHFKYQLFSGLAFFYSKSELFRSLAGMTADSNINEQKLVKCESNFRRITRKILQQNSLHYFFNHSFLLLPFLIIITMLLWELGGSFISKQVRLNKFKR